MPWFRVDDGFYDHPKLLAIPRADRVAAAGLWSLAGSYCARYLTDGFITDSMARQLGGTPRLIAGLVEARLWIPVDDGYQFYDWGDYQATRVEVEAKRRAWRARQAKLRAAKAQSERDSDEPP